MKGEKRGRGAGEQEGTEDVTMLLRSSAPLLLCILAAFALRLPGLFANTFSADEALFATWARYIATWRDPLLLTQLVDKPPLAFYLQALFFPFFGPVEWAARLPNFIAGLLLIPLTVRLYRRLYRSLIHDSQFTIRNSQLPITAVALFIALSPYAIQFSPTAYLDPLLVTLLVAALAARRPCWSGLLFGLALMAKYQALLFLPLLLVLQGLQGWRWAHWRRWLVGFLPLLALLLAWDLARTGTLSLWEAQMRSYGGLRLAWSWELWPRLGQWLAQGRYIFGGTAVALLLLALLLRKWDTEYHSVKTQRFTDRTERKLVKTSQGYNLLLDATLLLYLTGYLLVHWLLAVPVWDRYLLPLLPVVALLVGRAGEQGSRGAGVLGKVSLASLLFFTLVLFMVGPAVGAANGRFPIGGQVAADDGAAAVAAYFLEAPYGTVLYDHWYSWQWRYHFFDKGVYVNWVHYPAALAEDLRAFGRNEQPRFLALPAGDLATPFRRAVADAGFRLTPVTTSGTITLFEIEIGDQR